MNGGQQPETPIIIIERDEEEPVAKKEEKKPTRKRKWINIALSIAGIVAAIIMAFAAYKTWSYYYKLGISISVSPQENIEKLQRKASNEASEVIMTSDSILGVSMDIYAIH